MTFKPAHLLLILFATALPAMAQNLAVVNGKTIPSSRVDAMVKQLATQGQQDSPQLRAMVKQELITREVMMQEAEKSGIGSNPEIKNQLEIARQSLLIRGLMMEYIKKNPVTDAEVQAEYDKAKAQAGDKEYHAYHILVDKEEEAKAIISKLKTGAKFEELAKQSKDTGSASKGGDLDWASPATFVPPFSQAMVALQKGQFTETPVKTEFGYHVIKLDDIRTAKFPSLEEVKPRIIEGLQQQKVQTYQQALVKKAKVQ
ncbi:MULTISPECIES: peptidylprolyl isomerase [unclassified Undibacterium]|uniref:peptidylprolyl isomerase n=1 Tax=unclassified Undibacterium TaxID=2630295 RepID=UPI002AC9BE4B|nr:MULTISPECIES: peptidylprolyl isomerase [unclassified Undibacterium]MEB0141059.1 peptidylprolyl isomerase [Undibacterium sp. CCC2.1]MEB0174029.1 peptidylprolyl isomerase [Undibacterium sp. CCC1.1]MEB0177998.1 peptidylprolyl isomerase [Undibacterium sp. CCC3.4]MEB0217230.1 peptidylprolyl isomerase [Undibacterium sp. 5I2]WPX43283.1 peptidylprolyl isomerase [Undibacterium sp. CCC3.4]